MATTQTSKAAKKKAAKKDDKQAAKKGNGHSAAKVTREVVGPPIEESFDDEKASPLEGVPGDLHKMRPELVRRAMVEANLGSPDKVRKLSLAESVCQLHDYYKRVTKPEDLTACDRCDGVSDLNIDTCPYCGFGEETPKLVAIAGGAEKKTAPAKTETALAVAGEGDFAIPAGVTPEKLDAAVARVAGLKREASKNMWNLGREIGALFDGQLWKARVDKKGQPLYKSWTQFCDAELEMTPASANNLIDVAKRFSESDVQRVGSSKLALVLRAPEDKQAKLLEKAPGVSFRELQQRVTEIKQAEGHRRTSSDTGRKKTHPAPDKQAKTITVASILKEHTIPLYCRPEKQGEQPSKRAKRLADQPVGWLELERGVKVLFSFADSDKGLVLKARFKRG